jgi:predicted transcriptional regulator
MRRTTIFLDEQLDRELKALARRTDRPMASIVREALAEYVVSARETPPKPLGFVAAGRSGRRDTAERHEELLWKPPAKGRKR